MTTTVLEDKDIAELLTAERATSWMREALLAEHARRLVAPPRVHTDVGTGRLVFTTGSLRGEWFGYRSYDTLDVHPGEQVVVVHDATDGRVRGLAIGNELGPRRVGAIGGIAADTLASADADTLGLIGTGNQAWRQLWAISTVRRLSSVRVFSRTPELREAFAERARHELGISVEPVAGAREAVDGAAIVVLATSSATPVIQADWVAPGAFVTTLGPKQVGRAEFDRELVESADVAVTDSVGQVAAYDPPNILHGTSHEQRLTSLGAVLAGDAPGRTSEGQRTLFLSVGLAGTEVFLLNRLLDSLG